jgi:hypothetical protein
MNGKARQGFAGILLPVNNKGDSIHKDFATLVSVVIGTSFHLHLLI